MSLKLAAFVSDTPRQPDLRCRMNFEKQCKKAGGPKPARHTTHYPLATND